MTKKRWRNITYFNPCCFLSLLCCNSNRNNSLPIPIRFLDPLSNIEYIYIESVPATARVLNTILSRFPYRFRTDLPAIYALKSTTQYRVKMSFQVLCRPSIDSDDRRIQYLNFQWAGIGQLDICQHGRINYNA